jgi:hypothetical protein
VYIGQANDSNFDQILEEAEMEDIQPGQMKFVFEVKQSCYKLSEDIGPTPRHQ